MKERTNNWHRCYNDTHTTKSQDKDKRSCMQTTWQKCKANSMTGN